MAKQNNGKRDEEILWEAANKLRGSVEPPEYKHVVLSLIFLKFASDRFEEQKQKLISEGKIKYADMVEFYAKDNVFYMPEIARWEYIRKHSKQGDIALIVDTALSTVEDRNKATLKGALPENYFSRLDLETKNLASLIDTISGINTTIDKERDIFGRIYEYFLGKFQTLEGKSKGEFYTPKTIVKLIAEIIEPYFGKVYDPCCGSGGMFVQSMEFINRHQGNKKSVSIYGQESISATLKLAKMNLAIHGISANLGERASSSFSNDQHPDLKVDFIMANPPFNLKEWRAESELISDPRWDGYETPPASNANYGWILHMVSKLSENGVAGFILANGALSGGGDEYKIRRKMIENNLVEAIIILPMRMFYTTDISVTLWILNKNKKERSVKLPDTTREYRNRENEILFMDLRRIGEPFEKKYIQFGEQHIREVAKTYHTWQTKQFNDEYSNVPEYCYSATFEEIKAKDFSLVPSKYIEFINRDENIDFDEKMRSLQEGITKLLKDEETSKTELLKVFKELGYEIKL